MGRPPGARNGTSGQSGGAKNGSKPAATGGGGGGGKGVTKTSNTSTSTGGGTTDKDKNTVDRSQSNFPYDIRLNSYASLHNAVTKGTPRIKRILMEECDFIMECRICRNLFRSLPNFITHKLNYCKKAFDSTWCIGLSNLIQSEESPCAPSFNVEYEVDPELVLINAAANLSSTSDDTENIESESMSTTPRTRSVADFYKELEEKTKARNEKPQSQLTSATSQPCNETNNVIRLQLKPLVIPVAGGGSSNCSVVTSGGGMKSVVVQQRIVSNDPSSCDNTSTKSTKFLRKDTAILGPDGKVICTAPGKGIEQVVSRLTAQLKALEEKEAQKLAMLTKNSIVCDVCKTVFDSDKALRQHKRESLDCGKTWGFKSPNKTLSSSESVTKLSNDGDVTEGSEPEAAHTSSSKEATQSVRISRFISPSKGRRLSHHHHLHNTTKRNLSPVKKIKMKYIKLDSSLSSSNSSRELENGTRRQTGGTRSYSCNRCSSSFTTKHEISMHFALCTGVINYAYLKESEPPQEKIRISQRNDFPKASTYIPTPQASPSFSSIISESHTINLPNRRRQMSGASSSRGDTPTDEVNNNKQYKIGYQQQLHATSSTSTSSSSEEDDTLAVVPTPELEMLSVRMIEEEGDSDITSHDSGVSSSSSKKKSKLLSVPTSGASKKLKVYNASSSSSTKNFNDSRKTKVVGNGGGMLSETLEAKKTVNKTRADSTVTNRVKKQQSSAAFNLRKTVQSRIRKSRRILRRPPSPQKQRRKKQTSSSS